MRTQRSSFIGAGLAVLVAVGCGGGGEGDKVLVGPTRESLAAAADRTLEGGDYRIEFTQTFGSGGGAVVAEGTGAVDADNGRISMTMDMELPAQGAQSMEAVIDGGVMYMRMSMLGDEWVKLDFDSIAPGAGDLFESNTTQDPSQFLAFLKGANDVEELGAEEVRSVSTTHFAGSYTMDEALGGMTEKQRKAIDKLIEKLPDDVLTTEVPFDAWVDADGRVRRLDITMNMTGTDTIEMRMEMFDFGEDVSVDVPEDAVPIDDLMSSFSS